MKTLPLLGMMGALAATPVLAQDAPPPVEFYGGVAVVSNYIDKGHSNSNGNPALQGYLFGFGRNFYGGVWGSTVDMNTDDDVEIDFIFGYRDTLPSGVSYSLSYGSFFYNDSGWCCHNLSLRGTFPVSDQFKALGLLEVDLESGKLNTRAGFEYDFSPDWQLSGGVGHKQDAQSYGDLGVSRKLTDRTKVDLRYHDASDASGRVALGLYYDFLVGAR